MAGLTGQRPATVFGGHVTKEDMGTLIGGSSQDGSYVAERSRRTAGRGLSQGRAQRSKAR